MWPFRDPKNAAPIFDVDNTIGVGSRVRGDLSGPGGFRIDGSVEGAVESSGPVVVGETGSIEGGVRGSDVVVLGRVRGDVDASGHLEIGPKGTILGNITVTSLRMVPGGVFRGTSRMPGGDDAIDAAALGPADSSETERRGRTLPPPNGAVPPPPKLAESSPEGAVSQERLVATPGDTPADPERATGTS